MANTTNLATTAPQSNLETVEVLTDLAPGTVVELWDGDRAIVDHQDGADVYVVQPWLTLGRGPWIFHRSQVEAVHRCSQHATTIAGEPGATACTLADGHEGHHLFPQIGASS